MSEVGVGRAIVAIMRAMDDLRLGAICRALRRRLGWRQSDLAERAGVHQTTISRLERGELSTLSVTTVRRIFATLGARFEGAVWWRGGELDRLLDAAHAELVETAATVYQKRGWDVFPEVTFQRYGDRGSIDLLATLPAQRAVVVNEMKSDIYSEEDTHRRHDVKVRLVAGIVEERFRWRPVAVARVLVVPESMTTRRKITRHGVIFDAAYPSRARDLFRWLEEPIGPFAGIWFLSRKRPGAVREAPPGRMRVTVRGSRSRPERSTPAVAQPVPKHAPDA